MRPLSRILRPAGVESVSSGDRAEVTKTRDESRGSGHTDLAVALLEDFVRPSHADGHRRTKTEADHEQATVTGPRVGEGKCDGEEAGDLDKGAHGEEDGAIFVEAVGNGSNKEDSEEVRLFKQISTGSTQIRRPANHLPAK